MPIDFHAEHNRKSYAERRVDSRWIDAFARWAGEVDWKEVRAADIGCGGGLYTRAIAALGVREAVGVDYSAEMLRTAAETCGRFGNVRFALGSDSNTGLQGGSFDLLLERALIHHVPDLHACFGEASRLLRSGGKLIVQDRTPDDCMLPGDAAHLRGYMLEKFPELAAVELTRRPESGTVVSALRQAGFAAVREEKLWETRIVYDSAERLADDWRARRGRSILHELSDERLEELIAHLLSRLPDSGPIEERDRWTVWIAEKAGSPSA